MRWGFCRLIGTGLSALLLSTVAGWWVPGAGTVIAQSSDGYVARTRSHKVVKHPRLRKFAKIAAIGALTGGVGGLILGGSVLTHAAVGAGVRTGIEAAREHHHPRKARAAQQEPATTQ